MFAVEKDAFNKNMCIPSYSRWSTNESGAVSPSKAPDPLRLAVHMSHFQLSVSLLALWTSLLAVFTCASHSITYSFHKIIQSYSSSHHMAQHDCLEFSYSFSEVLSVFINKVSFDPFLVVGERTLYY